MPTCRINDFLKILRPWLDRDYIRKVYLDDRDQLILYFADGGQNTYRIDDCSQVQLKEVLEEIKQKQIPIEKQ
jgi:hypothetical protein